jgi:hypothetical protein
MTARAFELAKKIVSQQHPQMTHLLSPKFVPIRDASAFGFTNQRNAEIAGQYFTDMNLTEKKLVEQRDVFQKQLPQDIPWKYYENNIEDKKLISEMKSLYNSIFVNGDKLPAIRQAAVEDLDSAPSEDVQALIRTMEHRREKLKDEAENDVLPFLNPFADFWLYGKDGPEFAEVFAARPQWNEIINTAVDDHAFDFFEEDPVTNPDTVVAYTNEIRSKFTEFAFPETADDDLNSGINQIAQGHLEEHLLQYYNAKSLVPSEQAVLDDYRHEDVFSLALRNGFVSKETDPLGSHHTGH